MDSQFLRLNFKNIANGLIVAVMTAILMAVQAMITNPDFSVFALTFADFKVLANIGAIAGGGYLVKKFFSTSDGKVGGVL